VPKKKTVRKQNETNPEPTMSGTLEKTQKTPRRASPKAKKVTGKKTTKKTSLATGAAAFPGPTDEQIRIRAYFISERRHRLALPGDASSDWIEARRQLMAEAGLN
jgi:hypothetical protein